MAARKLSLNNWVDDGTIYRDEENEGETNLRGKKSNAWLPESCGMCSTNPSRRQSHCGNLGRDPLLPPTTEVYSEHKTGIQTGASSRWNHERWLTVTTEPSFPDRENASIPAAKMLAKSRARGVR